MMFKRKRQSSRGFTLIEVMTATTLMAGLQTSSYKGVKDKALAMKCQHNLRQLGMVLMASGTLPNAAFYPSGNLSCWEPRDCLWSGGEPTGCSPRSRWRRTAPSTAWTLAIVCSM